VVENFLIGEQFFSTWEETIHCSNFQSIPPYSLRVGRRRMPPEKLHIIHSYFPGNDLEDNIRMQKEDEFFK